MDVASLADLHSIATPSRTGNGLPSSAQSVPAVLERASSNTDAPVSVPSKTDAPGVNETRNDTSSGNLAKAIKQVNDAFSKRGENLYASFEKDEATGIQLVKIVEKKTNEIIRQMPPKEIIAFAQSLDAEQGWRGRLLLDKA